MNGRGGRKREKAKKMGGRDGVELIRREGRFLVV